ncbi:MULTISPECIES: hypothetical protein [Actinomycetes]|uniref:hypothetical protein n=1 Tax=Actinomycetes TaxID=1760 RepID=UPI001319E9E9|nr:MULTISPECIES: hypothetical protein [Actinomycetes]
MCSEADEAAAYLLCRMESEHRDDELGMARRRVAELLQLGVPAEVAQRAALLARV